MPAIYFIHGLGSTPTTATGTRLDAVTGTTSIKLDYRAEKTWAENWSSLLEQAQNATTDSIFVGESLGGFWASQFSMHFHARCLLLNPAIAPAWQLRQFIGSFNQGYGPIQITEDVVRSYNAARDQRIEWNKGKVGLMLSPGDPVINPQYTNTFYAGGWAAFTDWVDDGHGIDLDSSFEILGARIAAWGMESSYAKCLYCIRNNIVLPTGTEGV